MNFKQALIGIGTAVIFCVFLAAESADAQLFRNFAARQSATRQIRIQPRNLTPKASVPQPFTGYGSNLHRNFVIRQEQQNYLRTGVQPQQRGNILWEW